MIRSAYNSISDWLNKSDFRSQVLKGGGISLFVQVAFAGLSFISVTLLGKFLGASGYGEYANAQSWISVLTPVATLGLNYLLVRNITIFVSQKRWNEYHGLSRFSTWVTLGVSLLLMPLVIGVASLIYRGPENAGMFNALLIAVLLIPFFALSSLQQAKLRSLEKIAKSVLPDQVIRPTLLIVGIATLFFLAPRLLNSQSATFVGVVAAAISVTISTYWLHRQTQAEAYKLPPIYKATEWIKTSIPFMFTQSLNIFISQIAPIFLGILKDPSSTGLFAVSYRIAQLMNFFPMAVTFVIAPIIARLNANSEKAKLQKVLTSSVRLTFGAGIVMTALLVAGGKFLLGFIGSEFIAAFPVLVILCIGNLVNIAVGQSMILLDMTGYQKTVATVSVIIAVITLVLNLLLIPTMGYLGAALATAISAVINQVILLFYARKNIHYNAAII